LREEGRKRGRRGRGGLGYFLCPLCLTAHLVPRHGMGLYPRAPPSPRRPLSTPAAKEEGELTGLRRLVASYCAPEERRGEVEEVCRHLRSLLHQREGGEQGEELLQVLLHPANKKQK